MNPSLAALFCWIGIAGLFYLDRDESVRTSKALWLPVAWLWIIGSRPASFWLGMNQGNQTIYQQQLDGSPIDARVFGVLLAAGIIVLLRRRSTTGRFLRSSNPILIYFAFCLLSVLWSDFPDVALKRWFKAIGDLVMVLVVVTDAEPAAAIWRFVSRVGFVLFPASVLLIRYFDWGRGFDPDGNAMNIGVTADKNTLGVVTLVLALGALWRFCALLRAGPRPNRGRHLLASGTLLAFGVVLLLLAHSATSQVCFSLGAVLILATGLPSIRRSPATVHALILTIVLAAGVVDSLGGTAGVMHAMGRKTNLTGRTDIWAALLPQAVNPIVGTGFESFWLGPRLLTLWRVLPVHGLNEAHNGYIEVYLNLGWVGLSLIVFILVRGYQRACSAFRRHPEIGGLILAYVTASAVYSATEAGFRMLDPIWPFLLLAVVAAGGITAGAWPLAAPSRNETSKLSSADTFFVATAEGQGAAHGWGA